MIHHIVMIKLKAFQKISEKQEKAIEIKKALELLPSKIPEIKHYEIGLNIIESDRSSDLVIISKFNSIEEMETYIQHPNHQVVVGIIKANASNVSVVDYETF